MILTIFSLLIGCIGQDVRPGANGLHTVAFLTDDKSSATRAALRQAKRYCKKVEEKPFSVQSEEFTFICDMNEQSYIRGKKAAQAAMVVGSVAQSTTEDQTRQTVGEVLSTGGVVADQTLGDCYELQMTFQCL